MPGSKTYTSNKVNELFEIEMQESAQLVEDKKGKNIASTVFWEVLKIAASILGTTYYNYRFMLPEKEITDTIPYSEQLRLLLYHILGFIVLYILLTGLCKLFRWLIEIFFSKRVFPSVKKQSYDRFHKKILNYIYLGVSFENKFNVYLTHHLESEENLNYATDFDLTINYLSQSIYYFDKAYSGIDDIIPQRIKPNGRKEKANAKFLKYIGYSHLLVAFASAHNSLMRLVNSTEILKSKISDIPTTISESYKLSVDDLKQNYIVRLKDNYETLLVRTKSLKARSDAENIQNEK